MNDNIGCGTIILFLVIIAATFGTTIGLVIGIARMVSGWFG